MWRSLVVPVLVLTISVPVAARTVRVDCDKGQTIAAALEQNAPDLVIEFSGTCGEDVLIARDGVTLRGVGRAVVAGAASTPPAAAVTVQGASNVVLAAFMANDVDNRALEIRNGANVTVDGVTGTDSVSGIILRRGSSAFVRDSSFNGNANHGIEVWESSTLILEGAVEASQNGRVGLLVSGNSHASVTFFGVQLKVNQNDWGVFLQLGAEGHFASASPMSLTISGNTIAGLSVILDSVWAGHAAVSGSEVGIALSSGSASGSAGQMSVSGCSVGVSMANDSVLTGSITASGNQTGISAEDSSLALTNSSLTGNAVEDVRIRFGTRLSASATRAGTVSCDGTVLVRGTITCPATASAMVRSPRGSGGTSPTLDPFVID